MNYSLIDQNEQLAVVCQKARQHAAVALDTEFVRTRTYYPQLGLIQLFDGEQLVLIDPLTISDWTPFIALLSDTQVKKFLHAGGEDLEVFLHRFGVLPQPMIDTQILAAFSGQPLSWGFAAMVAHFTQVTLDKSESRTDWLARPLTQRQCDYAAADVHYLLPIAQQLMTLTEAAGNMAAALSECDQLCQRRLDVLQPQEAWRDITNAWQLRPRQLAALQLLAAWRLNVAREKDMAVNFVVREENLWKVARLCRAPWASWIILACQAMKSASTAKLWWRWWPTRRRCLKRRCRRRWAIWWIIRTTRTYSRRSRRWCRT